MDARHEALAGLRILVVEDEMMVAMLVEEMLLDLRCEVVGPVSTLDDALAAIRQQTFDGILLDANLHGRSSAPVADALLDRAVPYLLVTGYGSHEEDPPAFKAAPRITKPFTLEDLANGMTAAFGVSQACR